MPEILDKTAPKPLILIIDDDPEVIAIATAILKPENYDVTGAPSAKEALALLDLIHPQLIITDISMPEMDGIALLKVIKENAELKEIPCMVLSATSDKHLVWNAFLFGATDYSLKPVKKHILLKKVQSIVLQGKRAPDVALESSSLYAKGSLLLDFTVLSVSELGMKIRSPFPIPKGTDLRIDSPLFKEIIADPVKITVTECSEISGEYLLYISFEALIPAHQHRVKDVVVKLRESYRKKRVPGI